jgi:ABC-type uncharacterized transport system auxiliary subunit
MVVRLLATLIAACAASSSGCSSLLTSDVPPETVYWLEPPDFSVTAASADAPRLTLRLRAAPGLDTDRLLIRGPGATLNSYAGARWADNLPDVLASVFRTVLEDSGYFRQVSTTGARTDWNLDLELHAFFAVVGEGHSSPMAEMAMRGYLACDGNTMPIRIASTAAAHDDTLTAIAAGFQDAVNAAAAALLDRLSGQCRLQPAE